MRVSTALVGIAALSCGAYLTYKKLIADKRESDDESIIYAEGSRKLSDKVRRASMYAVGAVKTEANKLAEGFEEIKNADMIQRGEETLDVVKEKTEYLKKELDELKNLIASLADGGKDDEDDDLDDEFEEDDESDEADDIAAEAEEEVEDNTEEVLSKAFGEQSGFGFDK
ncbi:MAG: hypothetical protein LBN40_05760 [Oscillospiraceae bacterium]|jgi:hypothetical protein|nr:hypothetical protein [Oscillospiraceae bacterium]